MADDAPQQNPTPSTGSEGVTATSPFQTPQPATGDEPLGEPGKQALVTERAARKEAETLAKTLQQQLEATRLSSLSDAEKAVEIAKAETRAEVLRSVGGRLVDAEVRAASAGRLAGDQVDALLEGLDRSRFITDDGDVNREALTAWVGRFAPSTPPGPPRFGDVDQGVRTTSPPADQGEREVARSLFGAPS